MSLQVKWKSKTIETMEDAKAMIALFKKERPRVGGFDTETSGLHIILDKPFLVQFGWLNNNFKEGRTFAIDVELNPKLGMNVVKAWNRLASTLDIYLAHNVKFDMHMLANIGLEYKHENLSDTSFYMRLAHDNLHTKEGGPPMGLKEYTVRYVDPSAKFHEGKLSASKKAIAEEYNRQLKQATGLTIKALDEWLKDNTLEEDEMPPGYVEWKQSLPKYLQEKVVTKVESKMIRYNELPREDVLRYAHYDVIYVLEVWLKLWETVIARDNMDGLIIENQLIIPLYEMERVGFKTNKPYLIECKNKMRSYIREQREEMYELAGEKITVSQNEKIKGIINSLGAYCETTNGADLDLLVSKLEATGEAPRAVQFIKVVQELRTLEKWYAVYILRFLRDLNHTDRLYTQMNQVGAVSGRFTSDFQQFPKGAIKDKRGEELFSPRRMVETDTAIFYLDYSQIELRFQALYTILVGQADYNLCRAYMPYDCVLNGVEFDYKNPQHIVNWNKGWVEKTGEPWEPTDVHGATTTAATGLKPGDPEYKGARSSIGKRTNFAKNYGAQRAKIREMFPDKTEEEVTMIDQAYYKAFPGVKAYHSYCYEVARRVSNVPNLFGVKYWNVSGHKLINMLVQGSAAYYLKVKIIETHKLLKNYHSKFQMNIHDELSFEWDERDDPELFFKIKAIMEDYPDAYVPIVADMEVTTTTWKAKEEVETIEQVRGILNEKKGDCSRS